MIISNIAAVCAVIVGTVTIALQWAENIMLGKEGDEDDM